MFYNAIRNRDTKREEKTEETVMKKYALVMATILSVGMMAGCGSHTEAPVTESVPVEETVQSTETDAVTEAAPADTTPSATIVNENENSDIVYLGGLYAVSPTCDMNLALFQSAGEPVAIVEIPAENILYYGTYTTEDAKLEDGTEYTLLTVEDHKFGYFFLDEYTGILVDEDGNVYDAKAMDESFAMDMVNTTINGSGEDEMPSAEEQVAAVMADLVYVGGLAADGDESDLTIAFFRYQDDPLTLVYENGTIVEYGYNYTTEDAVLEDGTAYTAMTIGTTKCGYYFYEDGSGFVVDGNGNKYEAYPLEEDTANDYVRITIVGE